MRRTPQTSGDNAPPGLSKSPGSVHRCRRVREILGGFFWNEAIFYTGRAAKRGRGIRKITNSAHVARWRAGFEGAATERGTVKKQW